MLVAQSSTTRRLSGIPQLAPTPTDTDVQQLLSTPRSESSSPAGRPGMKDSRRKAARGGQLGRASRTVRTLAMAAMATLGSACYSYMPISSSPDAGMEVKLELNDRGRAALADSIGPAVKSITGSVESANAGVYDMRIHLVEFFNGTFQRWAGERLSVQEDYVLRSNEKRLDRRRSWLAGIGSAALLAAAIVTVDLLGGSDPPTTPIDRPPAGDQ